MYSTKGVRGVKMKEEREENKKEEKKFEKKFEIRRMLHCLWGACCAYGRKCDTIRRDGYMRRAKLGGRCQKDWRRGGLAQKDEVSAIRTFADIQPVNINR